MVAKPKKAAPKKAMPEAPMHRDMTPEAHDRMMKKAGKKAAPKKAGY